MNKKIAAAICILTMILTFAFPVSAKNNIALGCKIDSFCCESEGGKAEMLVDDDPGYATKWHASDGANHAGEPHWIILDFETEKTFYSVRLTKASQGSQDFGRTDLNASGFRFEISSDKKNWTVILEITDDGDYDICDRSFTPAAARYLKLIIINPEQDENSNENQAVRLYDLKVFEYIPAVTEDYEDGENSENEDDNIIITYAPKTFDFMLFLLLPVLFAFAISRIFSGQRSR